MRAGNQNALVGLAGACAVVFFESVMHTVNANPHVKGLAVLAAVILATFSVYTLTFQCFNSLDRRYLWRLRGSVYLGGRWSSSLTNLHDSTDRSGEVYIRHTRDSIEVKGVNYRTGESRPFSTWSSRLAVLTESSLILLYEIESSQDEGRVFKRGVMRLQLPTGKREALVGDFYDNAPSQAQGPIKLARDNSRRLWSRDAGNQ